MCLPDFVKFENIKQENAVIGYRNWKLEIKSSKLYSTYRNYEWNKVIDGPHEVKNSDSGIYSYYNYNYRYSNNNYYNSNKNNYNYNNRYNYNYKYNHISGIIFQYGKTAIHKEGYRSEYAIIKSFFTIRESDALDSKEFKRWINKFNKQINDLAIKFNATTIRWQDFVENNK